MTSDGENGVDIIRKVGDFRESRAIKLLPLCNLYLERCIRTNGIPTFLPNVI
jgi:hypothetical protein